MLITCVVLYIYVLGVSGSPTKNANTDKLVKLVKEVIDSTGLETAFVKLYTYLWLGFKRDEPINTRKRYNV